MPDLIEMRAAAVLAADDPRRLAWEERVKGLSPQVQAEWRALTGNSDARRAGVSAAEGSGLDLEMETAALLAKGDRLKERWEERVGASAELGAQWNAMVAEGEKLRAGLRNVEVPAELQARLMAQAESLVTRETGKRGRIGMRGISRPVRWMAAAAAVVICVFVGRNGLEMYAQARDVRGLEAIGAMAAANLESPSGMVLASSDERAVESALAAQHTEMKPMVMNYRLKGTRLLGGGVTTLGGHRTLFTRWERNGQQFTLYQFVPGEYQLREEFAAHEEALAMGGKGAGGGGGAGRSWYWSDPGNHCGWALLTSARDAENPFAWE